MGQRVVKEMGGGGGGLWEKPVNNKRNEMSDFVRKREKEIELH